MDTFARKKIAILRGGGAERLRCQQPQVMLVPLVTDRILGGPPSPPPAGKKHPDRELLFPATWHGAQARHTPAARQIGVHLVAGGFPDLARGGRSLMRARRNRVLYKRS